MASGFTFLNPKTQSDKVQLAFIIIGGALSIVLTAASPFLTYLLFTGIVASLTYSFSYWENLAKVTPHRAAEYIELPQPENPTRNQNEAVMGDVITKVIIATIISVVGLYFSLYFVAVSQLIVGAAVGTALSWFFIDQCVLSSQQALNKALQKAVTQHRTSQVRRLVRRGADPYAIDKHGNNAFHRAISNDASATPIILLLKSSDQHKKITFKKVLATIKIFFNQEMKQKVSDLGTPFKNILRENTQDNRLAFYQALGHLVNGFFSAGTTLINRLVQYLRQEIAYPKKLNAKNHARQTVGDLVNTRELAPAHRTVILAALGNPSKNRAPKRAENNSRQNTNFSARPVGLRTRRPPATKKTIKAKLKKRKYR